MLKIERGKSGCQVPTSTTKQKHTHSLKWNNALPGVENKSTILSQAKLSNVKYPLCFAKCALYKKSHKNECKINKTNIHI